MTQTKIRTDLPSDTADRCASCKHWQGKYGEVACSLLGVAIEQPTKSSCPSYESDGIPF